jgi:hypothetical protein
VIPDVETAVGMATLKFVGTLLHAEYSDLNEFSAPTVFFCLRRFSACGARAKEVTRVVQWNVCCVTGW